MNNRMLKFLKEDKFIHKFLISNIYNNNKYYNVFISTHDYSNTDVDHLSAHSRINPCPIKQKIYENLNNFNQNKHDNLMIKLQNNKDYILCQTAKKEFFNYLINQDMSYLNINSGLASDRLVYKTLVYKYMFNHRYM